MSSRLTLSAIVLLLLISGVNAMGSSVDGVWAMELTDNISRHLDLELFQISMVIPSENGSDIISNKGDLVFGHGQITTKTIPLTIVAGGFVHGDLGLRSGPRNRIFDRFGPSHGRLCSGRHRIGNGGRGGRSTASPFVGPKGIGVRM